MTDALVLGRSLPALQTALDLAEVGLSVVIAAPADEASPRPTSERDPEGSIAAFLHRVSAPILGTGAETDESLLPRMVTPGVTFVHTKAGNWVSQPTPEVLGIPASPLASQTMAAVGAGAAIRAYLDRLTPLLTVGKTRMLGELVRKRMGKTVLSRLVDPRIFERYGVRADEVEVAVAAPGLNEALSRAGALSSAVLAYADRNVARETRLDPTWHHGAVEAAILRRLEYYGVAMLDVEVAELRRIDQGWSARLANGDTLISRSVVGDQGSDPAPKPATAAHASALLPAEARVYAFIDMKRPDWLSVDDVAVAVSNGWSLRAESIPGTPDSVRAVVKSQRQPVREAEAAQLSDLEPRLRENMRELGFSIAEGARWRIMPVAAPFLSTDSRHDAAARLDGAAAEEPSLLPVGRALHGDDLGEALAHAHQRAVHLRRHLLGLEPSGE